MKDATYKEVEQLLERVVDIMQRERVKGCFPQGYKCSLPDALPDWLGYGYNETQVRSAVPTAREISEKDKIVDLLFKLKQVRDRKILIAAASGAYWEEIRIRGDWFKNKRPPAVMTLQRWHNTAMRNFIRLLSQSTN